RVLDPSEGAPGASLFSDVKRVSAQGRRRVRIQLHQPAGDLPMRMALPYSCPVPLDYQVNPAGVPLWGGSGPYRLAPYVPGKRLVIARNPYYRGHRPHGIGSVVVTFGGTVDGDIRAVESEQADLLDLDIPPELRPGLMARFGINKRQLFRFAGTVPYPL